MSLPDVTMTLPGHAVRPALAFFLLLALPRPEAPAEPIASDAFWTRVPAVTVVTPTANDPRLPLVRDAVEFWNRTFAEIDSPFRLSPVAIVSGEVPVGDLQRLSQAIVAHGGLASLPSSVTAQPGDLIVVLADAELVSFCARSASGNKALAAIKNMRSYPLTLPNVARNVIAHEIGDAIGLGHNDNPEMLMCGRPARCRPECFRLDE